MKATLTIKQGENGVAIELAAETVVGRGPLPELAFLAGITEWEYYAISKGGILYVGIPWTTKGSRRHFAIRREAGHAGDRYLIRDLDSLCGFRINGDGYVAGEIELKDRDIIHYGIEFQFCLK